MPFRWMVYAARCSLGILRAMEISSVDEPKMLALGAEQLIRWRMRALAVIRHLARIIVPALFAFEDRRIHWEISGERLTRIYVKLPISARGLILARSALARIVLVPNGIIERVEVEQRASVTSVTIENTDAPVAVALSRCVVFKERPRERYDSLAHPIRKVI
jgi:hypothetical protein